MTNLVPGLARTDTSTCAEPLEKLLLPIPNDGFAHTVFVKILSFDPSTGNATAGFALKEEGSYVPGGLTWECNPDFAQFIDFVFVQGPPPTPQIQEIAPKTPDFRVSRPNNGTQQGSVATQCEKDVTKILEFDVVDGDSQPLKLRPIDPKIVVTPINHIDHGDGT